MIQLTFNQPMVPVTSIDDLEKMEIHFKLEPALEGHWKWINTQTLRFEPRYDGAFKFPLSTTFNLTSLPSLESVAKTKLEKPAAFTFTTLGLSLEDCHW